MRDILKHILTGLTIVALTACGSSGESKTEVQENGLTKDINNLVPEEILDEIISLGMPIHRGGTPPTIEGIYEVAPDILTASNIASDTIGEKYADLHINFYKQNNQKLTIKIDYQQHSESGHGIGSFIVGTGNQFSIFSRIEGVEKGQEFISVQIYSGTITNEGIQDYYSALFMTDDKGDRKDVIIENGQGRVFYDSDGLAREISSMDFKFIKSQENKLLGSQDPAISSSLMLKN